MQVPLEISPMRLVRVLQFLSLLSLAIALYGGEVIESARFVNDVSNDYIESPASPAGKFGEIALVDVMSQRGAKVAQKMILNLAGLPSIEPVLSSASDFLGLLSIQRK